jgi:hypothetical protein
MDGIGVTTMLEPSEAEAILQLDSRDSLSGYLDGLEQLQNVARRWEASTQDGVLLVPPDEYLLDAVIAQCDLMPEVSARAFTGVSGVAAQVPELPVCDVCHDETARYDASADGGQGSGWAFMCEGCFVRSSNRALGMGVGQYLFTTDELRGPIRQVVDHIQKTCCGEDE